jgi:membrane dipeptidase
MLIVDAHLDLAYNVTRGRDVTLPALQQPVTHNEIPTVGLPDLRAGGVGLVCATIFAEPASSTIGSQPGYTDPESARKLAMEQWSWYAKQEREGRMRFVGRKSEIPDAPSPAGPQSAILLLEGADPLRSPADVAEWFGLGLRIVGLAWRQTRLAGGTGAPGPLTAEGRALVPELDRFGIIHDASHLAEESFWQLLELSGGPVIASHSNCRAIVPTDRQLSDEMIRAIAGRGGVIGINFYDKFLMRPTEYKTRRATFTDLIAHVRHVCDLTGSAAHVGIGTDLDGGLGREQIPQEMTTAGDLPRLADALSGAGFGDDAVAKIMGMNWIDYFRRNLADE